MTTRILIAGAGVGGLALAQALRRDRFDVVVYERDRTPQVRNQGYRIHIDGDGNAALRVPITIRAAERVEPWPSGPVTLLGDAIHAMPPTGGVGANTALQDAAALAGSLLETGGAAAYEQVMLPRGFDTVERSLAMARKMFS